MIFVRPALLVVNVKEKETARRAFNRLHCSSPEEKQALDVATPYGSPGKDIPETTNHKEPHLRVLSRVEMHVIHEIDTVDFNEKLSFKVIGPKIYSEKDAHKWFIEFVENEEVEFHMNSDSASLTIYQEGLSSVTEARSTLGELIQFLYLHVGMCSDTVKDAYNVISMHQDQRAYEKRG